MKTLKLKDGLYWCGVQNPTLRVFDVIMMTEFGTTYNSYLVKGGEKTALFETAKASSFEEYLEKVESLTDVRAIDYLVVSHTEPDHTGSIERLLDLNPRITIVGTAAALGYLKLIANRDFYSLAVKEGDALELGGVTLRFMPLPNLHWPDTMFTYLDGMRALVTCDSFGAHYSFDAVLRSAVKDEDGYNRAMKYYFDNIIGPFKKPFMQNALKRIEGLDFDMILTGHGPVLDSGVREIIETYTGWCNVQNPNKRKTVVVPYVSAYGYTRELSEAIEKGIRDSGDIEVRRYDMVDCDAESVMEQIFWAEGLLFGTPTIIGDALEPIWALVSAMHAPVHKGKLAAAFGSYGWSGEGVPNITERLKQLRLKVPDEGFRVRFKPTQNELTDAYEYGYNFGCLLLDKENDRRKKGTAPGKVKCLVCGAVFEAGTERCPVCGVSAENFVPVPDEESGFNKDSGERFLILGGGTAGVSAARAIRLRNATADITLVTEEAGLPYNRPMLTKSLFAGLDNAQIAIYDAAWYDENRIRLVHARVETLDPAKKQAVLQDGSTLPYDKCVLALGSRSFVPPVEGADKAGVVALRSQEDAGKLVALLDAGAKNAVVIGGGVLGLEAAWELKKAGCGVTVIETAPHLLTGKAAPEAARMLAEIMAEKGVRLVVADTAQSIEGSGRVTGVRLAGGEVLPADVVVFSTGVRARIEIAQAAGIACNRAIIVDEFMRTSAPDIYACGDCAELDGVNHCLWPEATAQGETAGANAAGEELPYEAQLPALALNTMGTALYAVGDNGARPDMAYKTALICDAHKRELAARYFLNGRLVGATLMGDTGAMAQTLQDVTEQKPYRKLFD